MEPGLLLAKRQVTGTPTYTYHREGCFMWLATFFVSIRCLSCLSRYSKGASGDGGLFSFVGCHAVYAASSCDV